MYSPKISESLIPLLYQLAKERKMPMTRLVDEILKTYLRGDYEKEKAKAEEGNNHA